MTILKEGDLDFAKAHIEKYYDSDFFPKPIDFEALWANWNEVKADLTSKNIQKLSISTPWILSAPKPAGTFRVVHQLDPIDCIVYTALVSSICEKVEAARPPTAANIACSYRIQKDDGSFFASGTGWPEFTSKTESLASEFAWVLSLDISDFYNQIYLHRLQNAIEYVDPQLKDIATDIEYFITAMNSKVSQGVPVGPAASIVLAEAILLDVDSFVIASGMKHTRYVDDFRIFCDSKNDLELLLERITIYLYETHRLSVATEKTKITQASVYVADTLHNDVAEERDEILDILDIFSPYSQDFEEADGLEQDEEEDEQEDAAGNSTSSESDVVEAVLDAAEKIKGSEVLDLAVARAVIRTARRNGVVELAEVLLENLCFYAPVASDVFVYFDSVTDAEFMNDHEQLLLSASKFDCARHEFLRYWLTWYLSRHVKLLKSAPMKKVVHESPWLPLRAIAAVAEGDLPWIRGYKNKISDHSPKERRAIIYASKILPADERNAWLKNVINNSVSKFDVWMAKWVLAM